MGTPDFAQVQLQALTEHAAQNGWKITGVICQPDKAQGRGKHLCAPPVKEYALRAGLAVYQPQTLRDEAFMTLLEQLQPELIVVAAYGKILPPAVLQYPRLGCINVHGSLLPRWRGAAPVQRAIMAGDTQTGITIMYMEEGLDTGDMLNTRPVAIEETDNAGTLFDKMAQSGAELLIQTIPALEQSSLTPVPQNSALATYAAKIEKADCCVSFDQPAQQLHNIIRGLSPAPRAQIRLCNAAGGEIVIKIDSSRVSDTEKRCEMPGQVLALDEKKGVITVACREGTLDILRLTPQGKSSMGAGDFIRGRKIKAGDCFKQIVL